MMKKILSHDIIRLTEYLDTVVYFFLLAFPNLKAAPAKSMLHDKHIRKQIIKYRKMLTETSDICRLSHKNIRIKAHARKKLKNFLTDNLINIVAPENYGAGSLTARMFYDRFITKSTYDEKTSGRIYLLAEKLANIEILWSEIDKIKTARTFYAFVLRNKREFKNLISDLANSKLDKGDDVTDYFPDASEIIELDDYLEKNGFRKILETDGKKMRISSSYRDDTHFDLLPYIVCFMRCVVAPVPIVCLILYSLLC